MTMDITYLFFLFHVQHFGDYYGLKVESWVESALEKSELS